MAILNGIVTVLLVISALILIVTVLLQPGESNGLGAIAGGAETFFGKNKAKTMEGKLALATKVSAGVFIVCALIVAVIGCQRRSKRSKRFSLWPLCLLYRKLRQSVGQRALRDNDRSGCSEVGAGTPPLYAEKCSARTKRVMK